MHRDPEMFVNPDVFNPDNFLPEQVASRYALAFTPFSSGPRNCIGEITVNGNMKSISHKMFDCYIWGFLNFNILHFKYS